MAVATADVIERARDRAASDPRFADILADLVAVEAGDAGSYAHAAAAAVNRQRRAEARARFVAGSLRTADVQRLLHLGTPQAVHRLRSRGRLIGLAVGNATWFPRWQFRDGEIRPDLDEILGPLAAFTADPVAADRVMRLERDELGGLSIAEALDRPRRAGAARTILTALGA